MWEDLRNRGFNIFPLGVRSKAPAGPWKQWQEETCTEEIAENENAGVVCGQISNNLFVIDLDDESLYPMMEKYHGKTFTVRTGKGYHFYFRWRAGTLVIPNAVMINTGGLHLDIRGQGGYVVAPGSVHPDTGRKYEIQCTAQPMIVDAAEIKSLLENNGFTGRHKVGATKGNVGKGNRNNNLFQLCRYYIREHGLLGEALLQAAEEFNKSKNDPPLHDSEVEIIAKSAENYARVPETIDTLHAAANLDESIEREIGDGNIDIMKLSDHMNTYPIPMIRNRIEAMYPGTEINVNSKMLMRKIPPTGYGLPYAFNATVIQAAKRKAYTKFGVYQCPVHVEERRELKPDSFYRIKDPKCKECNNRMELNRKESKFGMVQQVVLQELIEESDGKELVEYDAEIFDNHIGEVHVGDRKVFIARFRSVEDKDYNKIVFEVIGVEEYGLSENVRPTEEDIRRWKANPDFYGDCIRSFAYNLIWDDELRETFMFVMSGGNVDSKVKFRNRIHACIMGSPSTGKTRAMVDIQRVMPNSITQDASNISKAGLAAAMVNVGGDKMVPRGGLLPMFNGTVVALDEVNMLDAPELSNMNFAMEDGFVTMSKAGYPGTKLRAEVGIICGGNPKFGKYKDTLSIMDNFGMDAPFLSRFDLVWLLIDEPDPDLDDAKGRIRINPPVPPYDTEELRKIIVYVREITVTIPDDLTHRINGMYNNLRKQVSNKDLIIAERQRDAIYRLIAASSQWHLRDVATNEDFETAKRVMYKSLGSLNIETLKINSEKLNKEEAFRAAYNILKGDDGRADMDEVATEMSKSGIPLLQAAGYARSMARTEEFESEGNKVWQRED